MTTKDTQKSTHTPHKLEQKKEVLADNLRANLMRRKQQKREKSEKDE